MNNSINKAFSGWKIFVAVAIGLLISSWMFYSSLSTIQYVESKDNLGTHIWIDSNENGVVDYKDESDFKVSQNGTYKVRTVSST